MWRRAVGALVVAVGAAACTSGVEPDAQAERFADMHAQNASVVFSRDHAHAVPATWAATWVTGGTAGNAIDALVATGDTFHGSIVLRIQVTLDVNTISAEHVARCYRYTLDRYRDAPHGVRCPDLPALRLPTPPTPDPLTPTWATRVAATLTHLPDRTPATMRTALAALFDPAVWTVVGPYSRGAMYLIVHSGTSCLISDVPAAGPVIVRGPLERYDCTGG